MIGEFRVAVDRGDLAEGGSPGRTMAVVGSVVGGLIFGLLTVGFRGFQPAGWIGSIIGAVVVLLIYNAATGRKRGVTK